MIYHECPVVLFSLGSISSPLVSNHEIPSLMILSFSLLCKSGPMPRMSVPRESYDLISLPEQIPHSPTALGVLTVKIAGDIA